MLSDEELMRGYADDDPEAFEALYRRHRSRLFGYLLGRLKDRDAAEEVFQAVFAKLHQARVSYRSEIPFLPWLFTIARNALIDHLRRERRRQELFLPEDDLIERAAAAAADEPIEAAFAELASLSAAQRQALQLRFNDGLTFQEIARQLQLTPANARQIVSRAVARLRRLMTDRETRDA